MLITRKCYRFLWTPPASGINSYQVLGTAYEATVRSVLERYLGLESVRNVGGRGDAGIDLMADWNLPDKALNVMIQCKRVIKKSSPSLIREMEGAMLGAGFTDTSRHIGILASSMPPSEACMQRIQQSVLSLVFMLIESEHLMRLYSSFTFQKEHPEITVVPHRTGSSHHLHLYYKHKPLLRIN